MGRSGKVYFICSSGDSVSNPLSLFDVRKGELCDADIASRRAARPPKQQALHAGTPSSLCDHAATRARMHACHSTPIVLPAAAQPYSPACASSAQQGPAYLRLAQRPSPPTTRCVSVPPPCRPVLRCSVGQVWICRDGAREPLLGGRLRAWLRCRGVQF